RVRESEQGPLAPDLSVRGAGRDARGAVARRCDPRVRRPHTRIGARPGQARRARQGCGLREQADSGASDRRGLRWPSRARPARPRSILDDDAIAPARLVAVRRALFLDRDGTLIIDVGYPRDPAQVELIPGAAD